MNHWSPRTVRTVGHSKTQTSLLSLMSQLLFVIGGTNDDQLFSYTRFDIQLIIISAIGDGQEVFINTLFT